MIRLLSKPWLVSIQRASAPWWVTVTTLLAACGGGAGTPPAPWDAPRAAASARVIAAEGRVLEPLRRRALAADSAAIDPGALFDWAEFVYPQLFPGPQPDQRLEPYVFRHYPATGNYVGVANGEVLVLGPLTGGSIVSVGRLEDFHCNVRPRECPVVAGSLPVRRATLAAATSGTLAAVADGRVLGWGVAEPEGSVALPNARARIFGGLHSVLSVHVGKGEFHAIRPDGTLLMWGQDGYRKTEGGHYPYRSVAVTRPTPIPGLPKVADVTRCDPLVTFVLARDGTVWYAPGPQRNGAALPARLEGVEGVVALGQGSGECRGLFIRADGSVLAASTFNESLAARGEVPITVGPVDGLSDVASIQDESLVITRSGTLQVLEGLAPRTRGGNDWQATTRAVAGLPKVSRAVPWRNGSTSAWAVLAEDGVIYSLAPSRTQPPVVAFGAEEGFVDIVAAGDHITGLKRDGTVWSWGTNGFGQHAVGVGAATVSRGTSVQASFVNLDACSADLRRCKRPSLSLPVADRPAGVSLYNYGMALASDGRLLAWGDVHGSLSSALLQPVTGSVVRAVGGGLPPLRAIVGWGQVLVAEDGGLWAWGPHTGELDGLQGGALKTLAQPAPVPGYADVADAHLGCGRITALRRDGTLWHTPEFDPAADSAGVRGPVPVLGFDDVAALGGGNADNERGCESHVVRADGSVWRVRLRDLSISQVTGLPPASEVSCTYIGAPTCLARTRAGEVWGWGFNIDGNIGDGSRQARPQPVRGPALGIVRQVAVGDGGRALVGSGGMAAWGRVRTSNWTGTSIDTISTGPLVLADDAANLAWMAEDARTLVQRDGSLWLWGLYPDGRSCAGVRPECRRYQRVQGVMGRPRP